MGQHTDSQRKVIVRNTVLLGVIFGLLHLANMTGMLSHIARPMVVLATQIFGFEAVDRGYEIVIGKLVLPWTEDCSGINTLVMLWGVTLWANRQQRFGIASLARLMLCIPAALISNVFRILTLAGYRTVFFPDWESPQLHYFIGFVWLIPFLAPFVKDFSRKNRSEWLEIFYMAVVLALLAPVVFSPGGSIITLCTLFYLARNRLTHIHFQKNWLPNLIWGGAGLLIGWSRMESLWIPWLLVCPQFVDRATLLSLSGIVILSGTVFFFAMQGAWQFVIWGVLAFQAYLLLSGKEGPGVHSTSPSPTVPTMAVLAALVMAPFILSGLIGIRHEVERPLPGIMTRQLSFNSYQLRITGQPGDIALYWYGAYADGRHHSLRSCMRFRGVNLQTDKLEQTVQFGINKWMREFFIHERELKGSYPEYLLASFSPFSSPGVHLVFEAPKESMSSTFFAQESERMAQRLHRIMGERSLVAGR